MDEKEGAKDEIVINNKSNNNESNKQGITASWLNIGNVVILFSILSPLLCFMF